MKVKFGKTTLRINISFAAAVTLSLILDESGLCAAALFCCVIHELGHIVCLLIMGENPGLVELSFYGIKLERHGASGIGSFGEIIIHASGPTANFVLSALLFVCGDSSEIRTAATISFCVGVFNLLPCQPLDGGNILYYLLCRRMSEEKCGKICFCVSCVMIAPMIAAGLVVLVNSGNITLIAVSVYLAAAAMSNKKEKNIKI